MPLMNSPRKPRNSRPMRANIVFASCVGRTLAVGSARRLAGTGSPLRARGRSGDPSHVVTRIAAARRSASRAPPASAPGSAPAGTARRCTPSPPRDPCIRACACAGSAALRAARRPGRPSAAASAARRSVRAVRKRSDEHAFELVPAERRRRRRAAADRSAVSGNFSFRAIASSSASRSSGVSGGNSGMCTSSRPCRFRSTSSRSGRDVANTQMMRPRLRVSDISLASIE